jgi:hypothetical protein
LTTSLKVGDKVLGCLYAGSHVVADTGSAPCHELVRNTSGENVFLLLVDKPWFLTEGKTSCCAHHTFLLEFHSTLRINTPSSTPLSAVCNGENEANYRGAAW